MSKSATTTEELMEPVTPGEILLEEFILPAGLSQTALAKAIGVPPRRINEIVLGKRAITADTDLRLARYWGVSEGFFLNLQKSYDLRMQRAKMGDALEMIRPRAA
ncbi:MAG: transcriptional regulator [Brevundimonas sp. 32-68-21]|jgi:antitoxin HigA-1|uniref:HigA family addiction module antidote protein n=2 Tax=Caulobacteraceae TaxID=76892 RepID=A0AB37E9K0_9CAUL|nr:HigA family addiction module antitoxin [Brevundimonas sp.]MBA4332779.1 addiction module antidote protein, HigA family [Brevundimonas sp.]OGN46209.1 MAG: addiction module antidote protein, HigA family [Caulobacterales bacterium RIFCSPHIGHO2_12_FULL_68_13]OYX79658.1 MAG: transcriptional regulator [Brevundimonas sp. 32-68-21]QIH73929.1 HigA family addiction module antidote protein [Brevundimonas mediterranea]